MRGTITIFVKGGGYFTIEECEHSKFMDFKSEMENGRALLIVDGKLHTAVNAANTISIGWMNNDRQ